MTKSKTHSTKDAKPDPRTKSTKASSASSESMSSHQETDQCSTNNHGFNILNSDMYEDMRDFWGRSLESSNKRVFTSVECMADRNKNSQKILHSAKDLIANITTQNIQFSKDALGCKTAVDFLDLYKKAFNNHFDNISLFYGEITNFCQRCYDTNCKQFTST